MNTVISEIKDLKELKKAYLFVKQELNLKNTHTRDFNYYTKVHKQEPDFLISAKNNTNIVGVLLASKSSSDTLLIGELAIDKNTQGSGLGSKLMQHIKLNAKKHKIKTLMLGSRAQAEQFYLKLKYNPLLFVQLQGENRENEVAKITNNEITWKQINKNETKLIVDTKVLDKNLQNQIDNLPKSHTQYLFIKDLT